VISFLAGVVITVLVIAEVLVIWIIAFPDSWKSWTLGVNPRRERERRIGALEERRAVYLREAREQAEASKARAEEAVKKMLREWG
jgi:hypothetical protein